MDAYNTDTDGIPKEKLIPLILASGVGAGINLALLVASSALLKKTTWEGGDYATHWLQVAEVNNEHISEQEKIVGILHDVIEDSDWSYEDLYAVGFDTEIVEGVRSVTKEADDGEKYLDAVKRCSRNPIGRKVKKRDNRHNMDLTRGRRSPTPKQKYLYHISYSYLDAVERGDINGGSSVWSFLQMADYEGLLNAESYPYIADQLSEKISPALLLKFGKPKKVNTYAPRPV